MAPQNKRLLEYLREGHTINPLIAWTKLGIYRLSARVYDLRAAGHAITKTTKKVRNRFGEEIAVGCYKLEEAK